MILSHYFRNRFLTNAFNANLDSGTIAFPATYYLGFLIAKPPSEADTYEEIIGNNYSRVSINNNSTSFDIADKYSVTTIVNKIFSDPSGPWKNSGSDAENIIGVGFFDASSAGNLWFYCPITAKKVEGYHTAPTIKAGAVKLIFDKY